MCKKYINTVSKLYVWKPCERARRPCQSEVAGVLTQSAHCASASR